ncbi:MAG: hypothetical protein IKI71_04750 [Lachnospiraceae bacterium]|nr:hypothetical protein [Lachnospiraceae bacterium]
MASDVLYGNVAYRPYFDMRKFENSIYNKTIVREARIKTRKRFKVLDKILAAVLTVALIAFITMSIAVIYKNAVIKNKEVYIKKLESVLNKKVYEKNNVVTSLKTDMKFDEIKMKAYMELNMITPTEKNIISFDKSESGFVRQYENIR